jgi:hypothetical protein
MRKPAFLEALNTAPISIFLSEIRFSISFPSSAWSSECTSTEICLHYMCYQHSYFNDTSRFLARYFLRFTVLKCAVTPKFIIVYVGFQVFTAVTLKNTVFWDVMSPDPDDGGDTFLRNVGSYKRYTAYHPRRRYSSRSTSIFPNVWLIILH